MFEIYNYCTNEAEYVKNVYCWLTFFKIINSKRKAEIDTKHIN